MTSSEIRKQFLDFFASKNHQIVPSAPIVLKNDSTLLFTNAGMNQFKDYFLGNKVAENTRIANTQKCLRVSGKHNDLEEVGVDTYHHTMFEMLGNWSFGDYFKKEAIAWSWELLVDVLKIPTNRLYVTIFEGDEKENLPKDEEACNEWKKVIAEDRILLGNKKDNFWEMGETGPCGPCTEIHVDCRTDEERKQVDGKTLVNNDHPQVIEIWNNVFIQFNRLKDGSLELLPAKHVDTGMGFERLVRVLQNKTSNYDTDVFTGTIAETEKITALKYSYSDSKKDVAFRVLADHIRAISFTIADGQLPSNTGAGYVIRRILRRAVRYYYTYLNFKEPLLYRLLPIISTQFQTVFPELQQQKDFVQKVIKEEEESFLRTLGKGLERFSQYETSLILDTLSNVYKDPNDNESFSVKLKKHSGEPLVINGKLVFELYDTYGFPFDLTKLVANERGLNVDEVGFEKEMQQQKERSRAATIIDTEDWVVIDSLPLNEFVGYDSFELKTKLAKYRKTTSKNKTSYQFILEATPFYAESGGQVGDSGTLDFDGEIIEIYDTKKDNDLIIHFANKLPVNVSANIIAKINVEKRKAITQHHSATHLLHAALRKVLGNHVAQKGSLVNQEHLRFDFSHFAKVTSEEIVQLEKIVNEKIRKNIPVIIKETSKEEALTMGAMALFGEKYGDKVRVVIIDPNYSIELCGGTHVGHTGELGYFKIKHETAVAAGVRRMEAISGLAAEEYIEIELAELKSIKEQFKNPKDILKAVEDLANENNSLKKSLEKMEARQLVDIRNELLQKDETINGINFIADIIEVSNPDALKKICFDLKNNLSDYVAVLCSNIDGKAFVAIGISDSVVNSKSLDAGKLIKEIVAPIIKGGGGGQKNLATAGGQDASNLITVIEKIKSLL